MELGRNWGTLVSNNISNIPDFRTFINAGYSTVTKQLHIKSATGKIIIADDLLLQPVLNSQGRIDHYLGVLNDSKLSAGSPWTDNQFSELIKRFREDLTLQSIEFEIRSAGSLQGMKVHIHRQNVYKTIQNSSGGFEPINMNSINFRD